MFKNLLVPLDGSPMAESSLPAAAYLAGKLGARVTLIHCIERDAPEKVHGERHLSQPDEARSYLAEVAERSFPRAAQVACHTHEAAIADVPQSIIHHAQETPSTLIVMCTHGRSGLGKLLLGSIAQQIVGLGGPFDHAQGRPEEARMGGVPVLLIPPRPAGRSSAASAKEAAQRQPPQTFACQRLLVPLDGRKPHEEAIAVASDLARACNAGIHLLFVVATRRSLPHTDAAVGLLLPSATRAVLEIARQEAEEYLARHAARLRAAGHAVTTEVRRGDAPKAIAAAAKRGGENLIIMATHRKRALGAFWAGSVAPRVASYADRPLLLLPLGE